MSHAEPSIADATSTILNYEQFSKLVEEDIRGRSSEDGAAWLRKPQNLTSWLRELGFVRRSVEASMNFMAAERREHPANPAHLHNSQKLAIEAGWSEVVEEIERRKTRAMKFLSYVNARIKEASYLVDVSGAAKHNEVDLLVQLHKIENLLIDEENDRALDILSQLIDGFSEHDEIIDDGYVV